MLRVKIYFITLAVFMLGLCSLKTAYAQDNIRDKIEKIKLEKMVKKMDLDESTAETFKEKYKEFSKTLTELTKKRAKIYIQITQNIDGGSGLDSLLDEELTLEKQIDQQRLDFITDLKSILTAKQIAVMIIFERKFNMQLRKLLQDYRKLNKMDKDNKNN